MGSKVNCPFSYLWSLNVVLLSTPFAIITNLVFSIQIGVTAVLQLNDISLDSKAKWTAPMVNPKV